MTRHELVVDGRDAGQRLDAWVAAAGIELSRSQARHLIDAGAVRVGGAVRKAGYAVRAGDRVDIEVPPPPAPRAEPEELPLQVLYEDALLIAINKAPGMVVHPAPGRWHGTLVNALLHRWGRLPAADDVRPGIVHRLDRDTSGVMVIARTPAALEHLARQFHDRTVAKRYLAVVRGVLRRDTLVIDAAIGRHPTERKKMSTRAPRGRAAVTHVRVLERFAAATLVEASPHTGRTHQIRVHLAARGFPILGDAVYGGGAVAARSVAQRARTTLPTVARQALHAASLEVTHPERGDRIRFDAPLWADMEQLLAALRTAS
jgi:23S rRNA pseudouridine1911/1915/1917 synthase